MTEQSHSAVPSQPQTSPRSGNRPARRWFLLTAGALAAALIGAAASQAFSQGGPPWHRGGFAGGPFHMGAPFEPANAEERVDRMVRHLAIEIDATTEQQDKLRSIVKGAVRDLLPLRQKTQSAHERVHALLTQPAVDRAAIEAVRAEHMALADEASRRVARAFGDAAEVLTPEQRRKIDSHFGHRGGYWRPWHRG
jgi:Spy/CpxP family protein refolding chaperone